LEWRAVLKPHLYEPGQSPRPGREPHALKVHLRSGELVVLDSWTLSADHATLQGQGTRHTVLREPRESGPQTLTVESIALLETNEREQVSQLATGGLSTLTVVFGALSVACLSDPKSCFGSCPAFYLEKSSRVLVRGPDFNSLRPYARYPQGLPEGLDPALLVRKTPAPSTR